MALLGGIDQGTSSSRFCIFDTSGKIVAYHQVETRSIYPKEGWVEQDPYLILDSVKTCIEKATEKFVKNGGKISNIKALGIANQRESMLLWDSKTGKPLHNAIIWLDARTDITVRQLLKKVPRGDKFYFQKKCGLPIATYFSAVKYRWILDNATPEILKSLKEGTLRFGTIDTWLIYNLTGEFVTDVTNASRTMLMNLQTLEWDDELCSFFGIDKKTLPKICSSSEIYGYVTEGPCKGIPIAGCAGDQQAALVGQQCFQPGQGKNTYGTGCFMLFNTGNSIVTSSRGLLTTLGYQLKGKKPIYALEGSVAIAGAAVTWLRDNLNIIDDVAHIGELASQVPDCGGVYFVPAFSGLFAPYWRDDARGVIIGLTQFSDRRHIARATLEAVCFQTKEVLDAMNQDSGKQLFVLKVDGGMTVNKLCMQIQADLLNISIEIPEVKELTALGSILLAGMAVGIWKDESEIALDIKIESYAPNISDLERTKRYSSWKRAVERSFNLSDLATEVGTEEKKEVKAITQREDQSDPLGKLFSLIPFISGLLVASTFGYLIARKI